MFSEQKTRLSARTPRAFFTLDTFLWSPARIKKRELNLSYAKMAAIATSTPRIIDMIGWMKIKVTLENMQQAYWCNFLTNSAKRRSEISESHVILDLYMKTVRAKQAKGYFGYFVQRD